MATGNPYQQVAAELPSIEFVISLIERARSLKQDELTKLAEAQGLAAEKILRKDLRFIVDGQAADGDKPNVLDVKALKAKVLYDTQTFARMLTSAGEADKVKELRKKNTDPYAFGEALLAVAKKSKNELVKAMSKELAQGLELMSEVNERVAKGGHPAIDLKISRLGQQAWLHTDSATLLLRAACLANGITYDPVLANAPDHVRSPMRLVLSNVPPGTQSSPRKAKKAANSAKKDASGSNGAPEGAGGPAGGDSAVKG